MQTEFDALEHILEELAIERGRDVAFDLAGVNRQDRPAQCAPGCWATTSPARTRQNMPNQTPARAKTVESSGKGFASSISLRPPAHRNPRMRLAA